MRIARTLHRIGALTAFMLPAACTETPLEPVMRLGPGPLMSALSTNVYTSGSGDLTWDPILAAVADPNWPSTVCTSTPAVGLNADWQNPHNAFVLTGHPWQSSYFSAPWINARNTLASVGPGGHNWTKYRRTVSGNGSFVIRLLADNCSWIYLDGILVGVQPAGHTASNTSYGLTLNGTHTLEFIIFDGGGAAGGKYRLETTSNPPPPLNPDLDGDGHPNDSDAFPLNPTEWADSDGDGVGDNGDAFPNDASETKDTDGDGVGDNSDAYPNDPTRSKLDDTPPVITPTVTGNLGNNGWYTSNVAVSFSVTDPESSVSSETGCDPVSVTSDTQGVTFTCTATSSGGTASKSVTVRRDATPPSVSLVGNAANYTVDQSVAITCSASDAISGLSGACTGGASGDAYTFSLGSNAVSASATDNAGNQGSASGSFAVSVTPGSLCTLTRRWVTKAGVAQSMCKQLEAVEASIARGNHNSKSGQIGAYQDHVRAQSGKSIAADKAQILINLANSL